MRTDVENTILHMVEEITMRAVSLDDPLLELNLLDSISAVNLALQIEAEFQCHISASGIADCVKTPRALINYVVAHRRK